MNIDDAVRRLTELAKNYPDEIYNESEKALRLIAQIFANHVIPLTPKGVGGQAGLVGSIFGEVHRQRGKLIAIIGTPLKYGDVIEFGRAPGKFPPIDPLALWAEKKLGIEKSKAKGIAIAIAINIARRGFKSIPNGARMFEKGWEKTEPMAETIISGIPDKVLGNL